jgi:hypothetical protein
VAASRRGCLSLPTTSKKAAQGGRSSLPSLRQAFRPGEQALRLVDPVLRLRLVERLAAERGVVQVRQAGDGLAFRHRPAAL